MMVTKMLKLCKKKKIIQIISYGGHKFLSAGTTAGYIAEGAEDWTAEDCATAIGIPEDAREGYILSPAERPAIDVSEMMIATPMKYAIEKCQPFVLEDKSVFFVKSEKLAVFDEIKNKRYYLGCVDISDDGGGDECKLIVANDTFPMGVITPDRVNLNALKAYAMELCTGIEISEKQGFLDAGGQMEIIEEPDEAESEE